MKTKLTTLATVILATASLSAQQTKTGTPPELTTPDGVATRMGELKFRDGVPDLAMNRGAQGRSRK